MGIGHMATVFIPGAIVWFGSGVVFVTSSTISWIERGGGDWCHVGGLPRVLGGVVGRTVAGP